MMLCFSAVACWVFVFLFIYFVCPSLRIEDGFVVLAFGLRMELIGVRA
jgi:hypothetical protein